MSLEATLGNPVLPEAVNPAHMRPLVADTDTDIGRKIGDGETGGLRQQIGHIVQHVDHRAVLDFPAASAGREAKIKPMCELIVAIVALKLNAYTIGQGPADAADAGKPEVRLQGRRFPPCRWR